MRYHSLIIYIQEPVADYYEQLLLSAPYIIEEVKKHSQGKVAADLGMTAPKFSGIYNTLLAYNALHPLTKPEQ